MIKVKRAYDGKSEGDGFRVLVDHLWPRGLTKDKAGIDEWLKEISPSTELRQWFKHDPAKWEQFRKRYFEELKQHRDAVSKLAQKARNEVVTFVYSAKDELHNNAVALKDYIEAHMPK